MHFWRLGKLVFKQQSFFFSLLLHSFYFSPFCCWLAAVSFVNWLFRFGGPGEGLSEPLRAFPRLYFFISFHLFACFGYSSDSPVPTEFGIFQAGRAAATTKRCAVSQCWPGDRLGQQCLSILQYPCEIGSVSCLCNKFVVDISSVQ